MKTFFITIIAIMYIGLVHAQNKFEITSQGIVNSEAPNNPYIIISIPQLTQNEILQGIREYIQKYWKNPKKSFTIENNSAIISYNHIIPIDAKEYRLEGVMTIDAKDGKFRASFSLIGLYREVPSLAIYQHYHFTKEHCSQGSIYFRRGIYEGDKIKYPKQKSGIENVLNQEISDMTKYLTAQLQTDW